MKIAIIGRSEVLYDVARTFSAHGYEIVCILTAKEAPEYKLGAEDFRFLAEEWKIPYRCSGKIIDNLDFLINSNADIAVSINYSGIIPEEVIRIFPLGILNAHGGDLPRYRGNACQAWAIINGEKQIGLCIHKMIGGQLDNGPIITKDYMEIDDSIKIGQILNWIQIKTPELMLDAVKKLENNPIFFLEEQSIDPSKSLRCYPRKPEDGKICWNNSALSILRLINASNRPYQGAFCYFEDSKLIIWDAELDSENEVCVGIPGQVTAIFSNKVKVLCGTGKLSINLVEYDGNICSPSSFIKSTRSRFK